MSTNYQSLFCILISLSLCFTSVNAKEQSKVEDEYLWLENIDGERAMSWVENANQTTADKLTKDPLYQEIYNDVLAALDSKDKLPELNIIGDYVYQLQRSADKPRGVYERTKFDLFKAGKPAWQTVLDIDAMAKRDKQKWVFHGMSCLAPENKHCLVYLSPGGGDAHEMREFDAETLSFVENGFRLPTAKMQVNWVDKDTLYVATDFGKGSHTDSGYARQLKKWTRGSKLTDAEPIFEVAKESVRVWAQRFKHQDQAIDLVTDAPGFWTRKYYQLVEGKPTRLQLPDTAIILDMFAGNYLVSLKQDWLYEGENYRAGSVLLLDPDTLIEGKGSVTVLVESKPKFIIDSVVVAKDSVIVSAFEDVKSSLYRYYQEAGEWNSELVKLPSSGTISIASVSSDTGDVLARFEGFITPPTLYAYNTATGLAKVQQQSATFNAVGLKVEQFFAKSKDGTQVPYFVVMNKDTTFDGKNPTHIFAYGGFRVSVTPSYSGSYEDLNGAYGKAWLERGGVYVVANIRGGGEYGPAWHSAALLKNRNKAYEDFEAIAQDLFDRKITSAKHLGIEGRSNGGLLVGATMTRRPDLYGAVICGVPLLDMKRYNKLLAGASWMGEYGNPDTDDWQFIKQYSPYQNLKKGQKYPPTFFFTSTRDDRVHPGHARKMAARMKAFGQQVDYFENIEGGHKGSATSEQTAKRVAMSFVHLWRNLK